MPPARLLGRAKEPRLTSLVEKDMGSLAFPSPSMFWAFGGFPSSTGVPISPLTAIQVSTVYGCVKARSEDFAKVPIFIRQKIKSGGYENDLKHPVHKLLRRPNDWMTPFTFKRFIELSVCYRGNAYVVIKRGNGGDPQELVPVVPDNVTVEISPDGQVFYKLKHPRLAPNGQQIKLHADNVLHIKNIAFDGGYMGMSPIAAAQETIGLSLAAQQHGAVLFRQGAQIAGVLKHPGILTPEAKTSLSRDFAEKFTGVQNAHKVPVLEEGMDYEKISMTNEDAQFIELRKFQRHEICAIFRVPPHKVMDPEKISSGGFEELDRAYINDALIPDAQQMAEEFHNKLLFEDEKDKFSLFFDWDVLLRSDQRTRYEAYAIGLNNGFLNVNEVRDAESREHIEGGDEYRHPLNIGTGASQGAGSSPAGAPATGAPGNQMPNPTPKP